MGSLRTRDSHSFSPNRAALVPSTHGSPLAYFHRTPLAAYLGDSGREESPYCYHVRVSERSEKK